MGEKTGRRRTSLPSKVFENAQELPSCDGHLASHSLSATAETIFCHAERKRSISEPRKRFFASLRMTDDVALYRKLPYNFSTA
jgi:hypothetical protein